MDSMPQARRNNYGGHALNAMLERKPPIERWDSSFCSKVVIAQARPFSAWQDQLVNPPYMLKGLPDSRGEG
jgi:hypothetical protein